MSRQREVKKWSQHPDRAVLLGLSPEQSHEERLEWLWGWRSFLGVTGHVGLELERHQVFTYASGEMPDQDDLQKGHGLQFWLSAYLQLL